MDFIDVILVRVHTSYGSIIMPFFSSLCLVINLEEKLRKLEAERFSLAEQLTNSKYEMQVVKSRYDELKSNSMSKIDQEDHERIVIDFKM